MARREPTAGGDARRGRGGRGTSDKRKRRHARGRRRMGRHATAATHATTHRAPTQAAGQHPAAGSVWHGASTSASVTPLLALRPEPPARGALLTLAGAEQGTLADAFLAWSAERDAAANRAWRRPGGLARMAGL